MTPRRDLVRLVEHHNRAVESPNVLAPTPARQRRRLDPAGQLDALEARWGEAGAADR